jgi:hypothetical protein
MSQTITKPVEELGVRQPCTSLKELKNEFQAPIREAREAVREAVRDAAAKEIAAVRSAAAEYAEEGREIYGKCRQSAEGLIKARPIQAVLAAAVFGLVTGAVAGFIFRRR